VDFYHDGIFIGTSNSSSLVWSNVPKGNYLLTASATDNLDASTMSSAISISVTKSTSSVASARRRGNNILSTTDSASSTTYATTDATSSAAVSTASQIALDLDALTTDIENAYNDFLLEKTLFGVNAYKVEVQLRAAFYFCRADHALAAEAGLTQSVKDHLKRVVAHLAMSEDLMRYGRILPVTASDARVVSARTEPLIGAANVGYAPASSSMIAPLSLAGVFADGSSPLAAQTIFAALSPATALPFELAGTSVTIDGKCVRLLYVSPTRLTFYLGVDATLGAAEVLVTSQDGYVSRAVVSVANNATRIFTFSEQSNGLAVAINTAKQMDGNFTVTTAENLGPDKRTRLTIFATGISGSAANTDARNDLTVDGRIRSNFAESVIVEARTLNGSIFRLPVEFAGRLDGLPGLDQLSLVLINELSGAGSIELTVIVNGQRSNTTSIVIR
jgi:uncharacterized protein (TIGR03437 family)